MPWLQSPYLPLKRISLAWTALEQNSFPKRMPGFLNAEVLPQGFIELTNQKGNASDELQRSETLLANNSDSSRSKVYWSGNGSAKRMARREMISMNNIRHGGLVPWRQVSGLACGWKSSLTWIVTLENVVDHLRGPPKRAKQYQPGDEMWRKSWYAFQITVSREWGLSTKNFDDAFGEYYMTDCNLTTPKNPQRSPQYPTDHEKLRIEQH